MLNKRYKKNYNKLKFDKLKFNKIKFNNFKLNKFKLLLIAILIIIVLIFFYYLSVMRPVILNSIVHNGKIYATQILLQEVSDVIFDNDINYNNIISIQRGENGDVISTTVDSESINKIKIDISQKIMEKFLTQKSYKYNIQLGTLLGNEFSIGRGYDITMEIFPIGTVETQIISTFENAGINQTKHILSIIVTLEYNTIVPMNKSEGVVQSEFLLSETTIVGKVPQFYADLK